MLNKMPSEYIIGITLLHPLHFALKSQVVFRRSSMTQLQQGVQHVIMLIFLKH